MSSHWRITVKTFSDYPTGRALDWHLLYITIRRRGRPYNTVRKVFDKERGKTCCKVDYMFAQLLFVQKKYYGWVWSNFEIDELVPFDTNHDNVNTVCITKLAKVPDRKTVHKWRVIFGFSVLILRQYKSVLDQTTNNWFLNGYFLKHE